MWLDMGQDSLDPTILSTFANLNQCTIQFGGNGSMTQIRLYGLDRHHCQSERYPTMLFSQSYISPILGYYRNKTISSTKSHMLKSEPSVIPNMTNGDSSRVIHDTTTTLLRTASAACNDGGNRHAPIAASHHLLWRLIGWLGWAETPRNTPSDQFLTKFFGGQMLRCLLRCKTVLKVGGQIQKQLHHFLEIPSGLMSIPLVRCCCLNLWIPSHFLRRNQWKFWPQRPRCTLGL